MSLLTDNCIDALKRLRMISVLVVQTFLEQNEGPGLQHLALKTDDIFHTLRELRRRSDAGGFDFMPPASDAYYRWALGLSISLKVQGKDVRPC